MRVLDVSVAALIGLSSLTALAAWNPDQLSAESTLYAQQASKREFLLSLVDTIGLAWLQVASPDSICAALSSHSNSTLQVSAMGRDFVCYTAPPPAVPVASVTLQFPRGNLTLQAWRPEKA